MIKMIENHLLCYNCLSLSLFLYLRLPALCIEHYRYYEVLRHLPCQAQDEACCTDWQRSWLLMFFISLFMARQTLWTDENGKNRKQRETILALSAGIECHLNYLAWICLSVHPSIYHHPCVYVCIYVYELYSKTTYIFIFTCIHDICICMCICVYVYMCICI